MTLEIPQSLLEEVSKGRASLFLGAGASCEAGFPSSDDIAKFLTEKAGGAHSSYLDGQKLDTVANYLYLEQGFGPQWVRQKVIEYFEQYHKKVKRPPSKAHETLTKIRWRTIFTTNYDRLVEISYESSPECVQRVLPIYFPDSQILRHEEDVVRLIKLNGSVDEAARNSSHELVITFADQTKARSYNGRFYSLLQEEAVNGPIIFVGFSFSHPGTYEKATAPEYAILENLLREMGPAARWHYCVAPIDSSKIESKLLIKALQASRIQLINASSGDFIEELFRNLATPPSPLEKRLPVVVPIAQTSIKIDADDYAKDKRHFEIIGTHLEKDPPPSVAESLNGYENWSSFFNKHLIERSCKQDLLKKLQLASNDAPAIISFIASPGWGKTFLLRDACVDLYKRGKPILWLNPYSTIEARGRSGTPIIVGTWDMKRIDGLVGMINNKAAEDSVANESGVPLIISDNCPERVEEVLSLFRYLTSNNRLFVLVIAFRTNAFELLVEQHPLLKRGKIFRPEGSYNASEEIRTLIDFCTKNRVALIKNPEQREIVAQSILSSEAQTAIILALQIIFDKQHRPFAEIVKGIWTNIKNEYAKSIVLKIASLHRFGGIFYPRLYSLLNTFPPHEQIQVLQAYRECCKEGVLFEETENEEPCARTLHSLVAEKITDVSGKTRAEIDDELLLLSQRMTSNNLRDLELIRHLLKQINDYSISLSSEEKVDKLFRIAVESTNDDWVVCQQFSKYLLRNNEYEAAFAWANSALEKNPDNTALQHHKGNVLWRWGRKLTEEGKSEEANEKFHEARKYFTLSRIGSIPSEYGYVTHLDMLIYLINNSRSEAEKANFIAEGAQLYRQGVKVVPEDAYNLLLDDRFFIFDLKGNAVGELCQKIEKAIQEGRSSAYGAAFLAENIYRMGDYKRAIEILGKQREPGYEGVLLWVKEAEFHAREGNFAESAKSLHSAKMREKNAENAEVRWSLAYWDLVTSFALNEYGDARIAAGKLGGINFLIRQRLPRGYIWKESAKHVKPDERSFREHAKIWSGRVQNLRISGQYGRIELSSVGGQTFNIDFNPKYFYRRDLRVGDYVKFVVAILPYGLRAESIDAKPFANTIDDVFMK